MLSYSKPALVLFVTLRQSQWLDGVISRSRSADHHFHRIVFLDPVLPWRDAGYREGFRDRNAEIMGASGAESLNVGPASSWDRRSASDDSSFLAGSRNRNCSRSW